MITQWVKKILYKALYQENGFYSLFENNQENFGCKELDKYLKEFKGVSYIRGLLRDYGNGENFGDHNLAFKINSYVDQNRKKCLEMINLGKKVFIEDVD